MPGFITHYICGQAAYNAADTEIQKMIKPHRQFYNIGTQGPDIFFYYLPGFLKKQVRNIGIKMHKEHFHDFISHMIDTMNSERLPDDARSLLFAYISGFLTHYSLDATAHPYVYSQTGMRKKGDKAKAIKYTFNHRKFETAIDMLMLELMSSKKPSDHKLWELIKVDYSPAQVVASAMSASIYYAYGRDISPKDIYKAMVYMVNITRVIQSRTAKHKRFMELIENLTIGEHLFSNIVNMQSGVDYMNINKTPWHLPGVEEKTESFVELYHEALEGSVNMINTLLKHIKGEVSREKLFLTLGDRSLATGVEAMPAIVTI